MNLTLRRRSAPMLVDEAASPCQRCGRSRPLLAVKHEDEFCSRVCLEAAHGVMTDLARSERAQRAALVSRAGRGEG